MNADFFYSLSHHVGLSLIHSVWQFAAIALGLAIVLTVLRNRSSAIRYIAECLGQDHGAGMIALALLTALLVGGSMWVNVMVIDDAHAFQGEADVRGTSEIRTESPVTESDDREDNDEIEIRVSKSFDGNVRVRSPGDKRMDSLLTSNDPKARSDEGEVTQQPQPADNTGIERQEAAAPDQSLVVRLVDKDSKPITGVKVRLYDGRNVWRGRQVEYPMQMAVTDAHGGAVFAGLFNLIPKDSGYWIEFFKPEDSKFRYPKRLVGGGKSLVSTHREDPLIQTTVTATSVIYTLALRQECPTDIQIVDVDDRPIHMAHLLFRDDRVADWTLAGLQDYGESDSDSAEIVLHHYTTFVPEMSDAKFIAIREGYYPVEFTLPEALRLDRVVRKKIVLRRAPPVQLSVQEADGTPALGAKLAYVGPTPRGPYFPVKPAGNDGIIEMGYPAWGDQASFQLVHKGIEVQLEAKAWLSGQPQHDSSKPIEAMTQLPASGAAKKP